MLIPTDHEKRNETNVLGSMFRDESAVGEAIAIVSEEDFYFPEHRFVFLAILEVWKSGACVSGGLVDVSLVADVLKKKGQIDHVGGYVFLAGLLDYAPTGANVSHYANLVKDFSTRRQLNYAAKEIEKDTLSPIGPADEILGKAQTSIFGIGFDKDRSKIYTAKEVASQVMRSIDERIESGCQPGISTGLIDLDGLLGGWHNGELYILAARPGVGKTAYAVSAAFHAAHHGFATLFISLEQSRSELMERYFSGAANVNSSKIRRGLLTKEEISRIVIEACHVPEVLSIVDVSEQKIRNIFASAKRLKYSKNLKFLVVDYLQLITPEDKRMPRQEQVASISRSLKHVARDLEIPVLCLAQVNRNSDTRMDGKPKLSDLRESGGIEADADCVILLSHAADEVKGSPDCVLNFDVAKQRNGPTGEIQVMYRRNLLKFENLTIRMQ
jgi:replicative DNA helicase